MKWPSNKRIDGISYVVYALIWENRFQWCCMHNGYIDPSPAVKLLLNFILSFVFRFPCCRYRLLCSAFSKRIMFSVCSQMRLQIQLTLNYIELGMFNLSGEMLVNSNDYYDSNRVNTLHSHHINTVFRTE